MLSNRKYHLSNSLVLNGKTSFPKFKLQERQLQRSAKGKTVLLITKREGIAKSFMEIISESI
jgi:hypothetical protein